ncbi:hypothetical protein VZG28_08135 [Synechococcus elongatus IITB4]|uniref:hypothetical protein n=1 Tax=Synechococcus elongatus TaxID=32046 RepID=UPI0030CF7069
MAITSQNHKGREAFQKLMTWIVVFVCFIPSIFVGLTGLDRPYDAIPDQDMLWLSEALRLTRGVAPSYADHPGFFWSLIYKLNMYIFATCSNLTLVDNLGRILPENIDDLIRIARVENALLCGFCASLMYPLSRALRIRSFFSIIVALTTAFSSAVLVSVSEIRHEIISVIFMQLFILLVGLSSALKKKYLKFSLVLVGVLFFFMGALSKQQVLICSPLIFLSTLSISNFHVLLSTIRSNLGLSYVSRLMLLLLASIPWLISAVPAINLNYLIINLPFWIFINTGLALCVFFSLGLSGRGNLFFSLIFVGLLEIITFKLSIPSLWRQGVTGFPSWMLNFAFPDWIFHHINDDVAASGVVEGFYFYIQNLFKPFILSAIALLCIGTSSLFFLITNLDLSDLFSNATKKAIYVSWILILMIIFACSLRITSRYEIYFFTPLIITAMLCIEYWLRFSTAGLKNGLKAVLGFCSLILIMSASIRSGLNSFNLSVFVNQEQPRFFVCAPQHMDKSMQLTSAGRCEGFEITSLRKNHFDNWNGPQ